MINISAIAQALQELLQADSAVINGLPAEIGRGDYVNMEPETTPWVGVYRTGVTYEPLTMGNAARNLRGTISINVIVQESSMDSGRACEELLEGRVNSVLEAVLGDRKLSNTVSALVNIDVEYSYNETERESVHFQNATITVEYEVRTS